MESQIPVVQVTKNCREKIIRQIDYETIQSATISYCDSESPSKRRSVELDIQFLKDNNQTTQTQTRQKHMKVTIMPRMETVCLANPLPMQKFHIPDIVGAAFPTKLIENTKKTQSKHDDGHKTKWFSSLGGKKTVKTPESDTKKLPAKQRPPITVNCAEDQKPHQKKNKGIPNSKHFVQKSTNIDTQFKPEVDFLKTGHDPRPTTKEEISLRNPKRPKSLEIKKSVSLDSLLLPNSSQTFNIDPGLTDLDIKLLSNTMGSLEADLNNFIETCRRNVNISDRQMRATKIRRSEEEVTTLYLKDVTDKHMMRNQKHDYAAKLKRYQTGTNYQYTPQLTQLKPENVNRHDKATLMITNNSNDDEYLGQISVINMLNKRVKELERKIMGQEICTNTDNQVRNLTPEPKNIAERPSGLDEASNSHDKYTNYTPSVAFSKCETRKESNKSMLNEAAGMSKPDAQCFNHDINSINYDAQFNATTKVRSRRQSASMPLNKGSKCISSRTLHGAKSHNHRKSDILKEYRLLDMVHFLAQGEFAPRNDGIKLTPSREAVLSDIIWEDVCRSHFPTTNLLQRRHYRKERKILQRTDVQKQVDKLLREGASFMERKRRKNNDYRTVMNIGFQRAKSKGLGTTRDFVVANSKNSDTKDANSSIEENRKVKEESSQQFACESMEFLKEEECKINESVSVILNPIPKKDDHVISEEIKAVECSTLPKSEIEIGEDTEKKNIGELPNNGCNSASKRRKKLQMFANKYGYQELSKSLEKDGIYLKVLIPLIMGYKLSEKKRYTRQRRTFNKSFAKNQKKKNESSNKIVSKDKLTEETQTSMTHQGIISKHLTNTGNNLDVGRYSLDELSTNHQPTHTENAVKKQLKTNTFVTAAYNAMVEANYPNNIRIGAKDLNTESQKKDNFQTRCRYGGFLQENGDWILFDSLEDMEKGIEYLDKCESISANESVNMVKAKSFGTMYENNVSKDCFVQSQYPSEKHSETKSKALDESLICLPGQTRRHYLNDRESQTAPIMNVSCQCNEGTLRSQSCPRLIPFPCFVYFPSSISFLDSVAEGGAI